MSTPTRRSMRPSQPVPLLLVPAIAALEAGAVVGIPTDTVYGLAAHPARPGATEAVYTLKGRPADLDLPVLVADITQADGLAGTSGLPSTARRLAEAFWPGALTIVVRRRRGLDWMLGEHGTTIGLRCPDHAVVRALCDAVGPIATTSANRHGRPPCTEAEAVRREFGDRLAVVIDGGRCNGVPSTVADLTSAQPECLREGAISWPEVLAAAVVT